MTSIEERKERVRRGSRRQRDLQAVALDQGEGRRIPDDTRQTPEAEAAWSLVTEALTDRLASAAALYIRRLEVVGEHDGTLIIAGRPIVAGWVRRKLGSIVGDQVRELTSYRGVFICGAESGGGGWL